MAAVFHVPREMLSVFPYSLQYYVAEVNYSTTRTSMFLVLVMP